MLEVLEFEEGDCGCCEIEGQAWLVGLIYEVPNVDAIGLSDKDNSRASGGEGTASVVGSEGVSRTEDRSIEIFEGSLPDTEVEVMHCEDQVFEEWRSLECYNWSVVAFTFIHLTDVLGKLGSLLSCLTSSWLGLYAPVNKG